MLCQYVCGAFGSNRAWGRLICTGSSRKKASPIFFEVCSLPNLYLRISNTAALIYGTLEFQGRHVEVLEARCWGWKCRDEENQPNPKLATMIFGRAMCRCMPVMLMSAWAEERPVVIYLHNADSPRYTRDDDDAYDDDDDANLDCDACDDDDDDNSIGGLSC